MPLESHKFIRGSMSKNMGSFWGIMNIEFMKGENLLEGETKCYGPVYQAF